MSQSNPENGPLYTRRQVLGIIRDGLAVIGGATVIGGTGYGLSKGAELLAGQPSLTPSPTPELPTPQPQEKQFTLATIGQAEKVSLPGVGWYPDGHTSFLRNPDGTISLWLAGGPSGYRIQGKDFTTLGSEIKSVIAPEKKETFDRNYASPGAVIPGKNSNELLMLYHGEYHPKTGATFPFNAGIGLAVSTDNGVTWAKRGQVLKGINEKPSDTRPSGAGEPCAVINGDYVYMYYIDWNGSTDAIHMARSPLQANCAPGSWEKFHEGKFQKPGMEGPSTPVILPTTTEEGYAGLPGVSWNSHLEKFLAVYESRSGFFVSTSKDGIVWEKQQKLLSVLTGTNSPKSGDIWNSYPTLVSPDKASDRETGKEMLLLYSEGKWNRGSHTMVKRLVKLV